MSISNYCILLLILTVISWNNVLSAPKEKQSYIICSKFTSCECAATPKNGISINHCMSLDFPDNLFAGLPDLLNISLAYNNLQNIPAMYFYYQESLLNLDLSYNAIITLDDNIFKRTKSLKVLRLSHNRLKHISRQLISGLKNLEELYLDNNSLHSIHCFAFEGTTNLRVLHLQNNFLDFNDWPKNAKEDALNDPAVLDALQWNIGNLSPFYCLTKLQILNLRNNSVTCLSNDWLSENATLKYLDLSHNQIEVLTITNSYKWNQPITINVTNNKISQINMLPLETELKRGNNAPVTWILNDNPLDCECASRNFFDYINNHKWHLLRKFKTKVVTNELRCASPFTLKGRKIDHVHSFDCHLWYNL